MFFIPQIGNEKDIRLASKYKMDFIRIGVDIKDYKSTERYIKVSKDNSMFVAVNFMKSYASKTSEFVKAAKHVANCGADLVYIVDSAGGMLPHELSKYISELKKNVDIPFGFHGHNNLHLSNTNTLLALSQGAQVVDASLQGLGRSAGNASLEAIVFLLLRYGFRLKLDPLKLLEVSEKYIIPLMKDPGKSRSLDLVSGFSQFHTSYMSIIEEAAKKFKIDAKKLIILVCKKEKVSVTKKIVIDEAKKLSKSKDSFKDHDLDYNFKKYFGNEQN